MKKYSIIFFLIFASLNAWSQTTNYQVHSLFVLNIAKYSTWPGEVTDLTIAVYGKSKIVDELNKLVAGKKVNGATIKVVQIDDITSIANAQIVFLADGKSGDLQDVQKATEGKPVMIIAEREGLFKKGAGFSFVLMENNTLRYDINHAELEKRQIKVSKNLSSLANTMI